MLSSTGKRPTMQIRAAAGNHAGGEVERLCTSLDVCDRKLAKMLLDT